MMRFQLNAKGFDLSDSEQDEIGFHVDRLEKRLSSFDPDAVALEITVGKQARRREFTGSAKLFILGRALAVQRNRAPDAGRLIRLIFADSDDQLEPGPRAHERSA
jgi:hypothetical protein